MTPRIWQILFYSLWFLTMMLQAVFTPLLADEAYYILFAQKIARGYFDHPPAVALMIKAGLCLSNTEAGVRCVAVLLSAGSIFLIEQLIKPKNKLLFYGLILSTSILHFIGFVATPDVPFLCFTLLFWLAYQKYTLNYSLKHALLVGAMAAAMLLSKYHGVLVIGFTVMSNPTLFKRKTFWLSALFTVILLTPHLIWQMEHDFPSFRYHLLERGSLGYDVTNTLKYLPAILLMMGPLISPFLLWGGVAIKPHNSTEKALKYCFAGTLLFFLMMTYKGSVEPHWLMPALIPALYCGQKHIEKSRKRTRWALVLSMISIIMIIPVRIVITAGSGSIETGNLKIKNPFADPGDWIASTSQLAGDRPVAFMNSYQKASLYTFYSGKPAFSLNNVAGRKNQFDLWQTADAHHGREVIIILNYSDSGYDTIPGTRPVMLYRNCENFRSFGNVRIEIPEPPAINPNGDSITVTAIVHLPASERLAPLTPETHLSVQLFRQKRIVADYQTDVAVSEAIHGRRVRLQIPAPIDQGVYGMFVSVRAGWLPPTINSKRVVFEILTDKD